MDLNQTQVIVQTVKRPASRKVMTITSTTLIPPLRPKSSQAERHFSRNTGQHSQLSYKNRISMKGTKTSSLKYNLQLEALRNNRKEK